MKDLTPEQAILFELATDHDSSYETEYDGRTYTFCKYCDTPDSSDDHDDDCVILRAREALGSIWDEYVQEQERKAQEAREEAKRECERQRKRDEQKRRQREKINCDVCGKSVSRQGLKDHKASGSCERHLHNNEMREGEERTGIKCISDPFVNYTGKRCKQCNKPMPDAHPNAVFCSNKGVGNCKDRYHNMSAERVDRAREYSGQNARERAQHTSLEALLAQKCEQEGWDEHKDHLF